MMFKLLRMTQGGVENVQYATNLYGWLRTVRFQRPLMTHTKFERDPTKSTREKRAFYHRKWKYVQVEIPV